VTNDEHPKNAVMRLIKEAAPKAANVADFAAAARKRGRQVAAPASTLQILGNNSAGVIGNNNHVEIKVTSPKKPRPIIQPGPQHITDTQAAEIHELVAKVVAVSGKPFPFVWETIRRRFRFRAYRLMEREKYEDVRRYLRTWIASAEAQEGKGNPATASANRKRLLARIHAEAKKQKGLLDRVKTYAYDRFEVQSLGDLSPDELGEVVRQFKL